MGLLDGLMGDSWDDPRTQAMLALSAGLLSNNGSKGLSAGLLGAGQAFQGARDAESARALKKAQADELISQMQERQAKQAQIEAAMKAEQQKRAALPQVMAGNLPPAQPGQLGSGSFGAQEPAQGLPQIRQGQGLNVMAGLQSGYSPDELQKLAGLSNIGQEEVARTVNVPGPNGEKMLQQLDKFGRPVGKPMTEFEAAQMINLGDRQVAATPRHGMSFQMGQTPDSRASNALGWANNSISSQRLAFEQSQANKPTYDAERGIVVDPRGATAQPVMLNGQPVGAKNKELTEAQAKANLFGSRMAEANKVLGEMAAKGVEMPSLIKQGSERIPGVGGMAGVVGNLAASPGQQMVEQAQRDFLNAVLRRESGAVISPDEFINARKQYFPQPFDSAEVKAQKAKNRELAIAGLRAEVPSGKATAQPAIKPAYKWVNGELVRND